MVGCDDGLLDGVYISAAEVKCATLYSAITD